MRDIEHLPALALLAAVLIGIGIVIPPLGGTILTPAWIGLFGAAIGSSPAVLCEPTDGKLGAYNYCVTRACYAAHDCGHWLHPERWRDRVKLGDDIATVVFWLGDPSRIDGETYHWIGGKGGGPYPTFSATFKDGRLAVLGPIVMRNGL